MYILKERENMKPLNNRGISLVEIIVTFTLVMVIVSGLMAIIMNYRLKAQSSFSRLELQTYKNTLTKTIQDDILTYGLSEINNGGSCASATNKNRFSACSNLVFKNGSERILAVSKVEPNNRDSLENKYIYYNDEKYMIQDTIPQKIPSGRQAYDFQSVFLSTDHFVSTDSAFLADGTEVKIFSIDISIEHIDYEEDFGLHIVASNADFLTTNAMAAEFRYTGDVQEYIVPADGTYRIELWGASGGDLEPYVGGKGSYTDGYIALKKNQILYVYVGGQGTNTAVGGYNGGDSLLPGEEAFGSSGGGATDIRLTGGAWNSFDSLKSRIMVAAGGGGANYRNSTSENDKKMYGSGNGGSGGGLWGYAGTSESFASDSVSGYQSHNSYSIGTGGTQVLGGTRKGYNGTSQLISSAIAGGFGKGSSQEQSGGGGGWYTGSRSSHGGAGGGSSYISGHIGCQAISPSATESNITHKANSEYDSYVFTNTVMIDGDGYAWTSTTQPTKKQPMPSNGVTLVENGNTGDGYARITYLGL